MMVRGGKIVNFRRVMGGVLGDMGVKKIRSRRKGVVLFEVALSPGICRKIYPCTPHPWCFSGGYERCRE